MKSPRTGHLLWAILCVALLAIVGWQRREIAMLRAASTAVPVDPAAPQPAVAIQPASDTIAAPAKTKTTVQAMSAPLPSVPPRAAIDPRFAPLVQQLGLSEKEAAQLTALLQQRLAAGSDTTIKAQIDAEITTLLGPDRFAQYQALEKDQRSQTTIANLQKQLMPAGLALTPEQSLALQQALTAKGPLQFGVRQVTDDVVAAARSFLSPAQIDGLQRFQQKQQETVRAKLLLRDPATASSPAPKS